MIQAIPADQDVRLASDAEMTAVGNILGSAFTNDPVMNWFCPAPDIYGYLFLNDALGLYQQHDHVFINRSQTGAAMWLPPNISTHAPFSMTSLAMIWQIFWHGGAAALLRGQLIQDTMKQHHITEPHYYLHAIGARLDCQGKGVGSALMKQGTRICDEHDMPAYLESSNVKNNPLYERFGFEIIEEVQLPDGGPSFWSMRRPAKSES